MQHEPVEGLPSHKASATKDGRPMYHPKDLLKLYIYGYLNRIRTSRLLEHECDRNVEVIWLLKGLLKGLRPCFLMIAVFRSDHPEAFRNTFRHFVGGLNKSGLLSGKVVTIDGTKFKAVNSKKNNFNQMKIDRHLAYIDQKIDSYMSELDEGDLTEAESTAIKTKIKHHREHRKMYKSQENQLQQFGEDQISTTDPDASSMVIHGQVVEVAYNLQTIVDDKHNLILEYEPTNLNDRKALHGLAVKVKELYGKKRITALADKGYHNAQQLDSCAKEGIVTYVAPQDAAHSNPVPTPEYYGQRFNYNKQRDTYSCPEGQVLHTNGQWYQKKYQYKSSTRAMHGACRMCKALPNS